jgi:hypothetical protein
VSLTRWFVSRHELQTLKWNLKLEKVNYEIPELEIRE